MRNISARGRRGLAVVGAITAVGILASVAFAATAPPPLSKLRGSVTADGSSTVGPYTTAAAELFSRAGAKNVRVTVGISGTGGGFERFCKGEIDLADASRPMKLKEAAVCKTNNIGSWRAFTVANDALTVVVNKSNTWATCLSVDELKKIWNTGSKVNNWKEVRAGFPDEKLKLFGPGTDSGTFDYFTDVINGEEGASRTDYTPTEDDNVTVQGVSGSKGGLGYFGFSYFEENADALTALEIDSGAGCVAPSAANAQNGTYVPLSRPLLVYPSKQALTRPEVRAFFDYYIENDAAIAEGAQFIPLNADQQAKLQADYAALTQ